MYHWSPQFQKYRNASKRRLMALYPFHSTYTSDISQPQASVQVTSYADDINTHNLTQAPKHTYSAT